MKAPCITVTLSFAFLCAAAHADNIRAVATFNNIGVEVQFDAAPAPDAAVTMAIKEAGSPGPYRKVHPLSRIAANRFAGSAFRLAAGTRYSIRLASPALAGDRFVDVTTRRDSFPEATGAVYHVKPDGNDGHTGLAPAQAFKTIAKALSVARAGDQIRLDNGRYYESGVSVPRSGAAGKPIVIRNAPGAKPILDGTDTSFSPAWTLHDAATKVYRTPTKRKPYNAYINGKHLYHYRSLADLAGNRWGTAGGYYADGAHMYVRFPNGNPPDRYAVTVPRGGTAIMLEKKNHVHIRGIEFAYFGTSLFSRAIYIDGGKYNLIDRCSFHHVIIGVALKRAADFNTVQHCHFDESPLAPWSFEAMKHGAGSYETGAIYVYAGKQPNTGNVIRHNVIQNMGDGAHLYSSHPAGPTTHMDFHDNRVTGLSDDGIETDGAGSNVRIYNNAFIGFLTGISVAPAQGGPTYIFRNVVADWHPSQSKAYQGYPFKFNFKSAFTTDWVYLYHNTCHTARPGQPGFLLKSYCKWRGVVSRNNIYAGTRYALESWPRSKFPVDFDYDDLYTTDPERLIAWGGKKHGTLADYSAATGQEKHGVSAPPGFVDVTKGDYRLAPGSAVIDKGVVIPGVNDDHAGAAPDLGAFEHTPPAAAAPGARSGLARYLVLGVVAGIILAVWYLVRRRGRRSGRSAHAPGRPPDATPACVASVRSARSTAPVSPRSAV